MIKSQSGSIIVIILVVVLILLAGAGAYYLVAQNTSQSVQSERPDTIDSASPQNSITPNASNPTNWIYQKE